VDKHSLLIWLKRILNLWQQLTAPSLSVKDGDERIRVRFLTQLFLVVFIIITGILTLRFLLVPDVPNILLRLVIVWISGSLLLGSYVVVRKGYITLAGILLVVQSTVLVFGLTAISVSMFAYLSTLMYLALVVLFCSQFYSIRFTLLVAFFHLIMMALMPLIIPFVRLDQMVKGPMAFYIVVTALAVLFVYYRTRIENTQRNQLAESESRFKMVSDLIPNYAFSVRVEKDGLIRDEWLTDEFTRITGYNIADIDDTLTAKLFHPDDLLRFIESVQKAYAGQSSVDDYRIFTKKGELRWLRLSRNIVWNNAENRLERYYGVAQDITAQKDAEAQKLDLVVQEERSKLVRDFVTAFSHDFRTALATIETSRYLAERLLQKSQVDEALAKLSSIRRSVTHMSVQLENLNVISSLTNLQRHPCDLNELIQDVVTEYASKAQQHDQMIVFQPNAYLPRLNVDIAELRRAFRELLRNALSFMPSGGVVTVKTLIADKDVQVVIQDTGVGISQEHVDHIFELFYRVDSARGVNSGGVGLGLSVTKMIVVAHGGTITVESVPEVGSTFTVRLPLGKAS
jgi:PAS domain S-box-containing protein